MPETFRRKVATGSVRQSLYAMRTDLLPSQIREDSLASWVMNFDSLRERGEPQRDERRPDLWAIDLFVTSSLQRQIPFYFASLFHIGRQWKVSEQAISDVEKASSTDNLRMSTRLTANRLRSRDKRLASLFGRESEVATEALVVLLNSSADEHRTRLSEARRWWAEWRTEVERLRHDVNRINESTLGDSGTRLWRELASLAVQSYRPSQLRMSLHVAGVTFPHHPESDVARPAALYSELLSPLMLLAVSQGKFREPFFHEFAFELRHVIHDIKEEIAFGESRRIALERLRRKYADTDPFKHYLPLHSPADEKLRNLVLEHTVPGYGREPYSPWLATWKKCIEYDVRTTTNLAPPDVHDKSAVSGFARWADCAIKNALPGDFLPGETWELMAQRIFEKEWIETFAGQISDSKDEWSFDEFARLIEQVALALNEMGYQLKSPTLYRLKKLWSNLHSDDRSDDEW